MFEYLLIDGVNDRPEDADNLAKLMKGSLYHVNLIKYHADTGGDFNPSPQAKRTHFLTLLRNSRRFRHFPCFFRRRHPGRLRPVGGKMGMK